MSGFTFTKAVKPEPLPTGPRLHIEATPFADRVMNKVHVTGPGCWEWTGYRMPAGYGVTGPGAASRLAHRVSFMLWNPAVNVVGLEIDHLCRNRACINPFHLEAVSGAINRKRQGAAVTHCPAGHEYTPENTYASPRTPRQRRCRTCTRDKQRAKKGLS